MRSELDDSAAEVRLLNYRPGPPWLNRWTLAALGLLVLVVLGIGAMLLGYAARVELEAPHPTKFKMELAPPANRS